MITTETHRFVIRQDASGLDAFWVKRHLVRLTDIDCTEMDEDTFGDLYQSKRDALKAGAAEVTQS